ncbi:hypothetical protein KK062_18355 [Fulvivirgaceae bacterium PWU5]|uniref:Uncharacterized protein n=1 Tax=Dawidia cretensis TaxID=2782350 RepID=A0AAP2DZU8_9BACT|nr:DUF6588 family protein [Dawidia cretensis]MBT1710215.1 hypothetical protein [Dawidia cretensis]
MKFLRLAALAGMLTFTATTATYAQDDIDKLIRENAADGEKLVSGYIAPFMKSFALGLNSGWYNTAKPHKLIGIDLTITVSAMRIPNKEMFYTVPTNLTSIELVNGGTASPAGQAPTIIGPDQAPVYRVKGTGETFEGPEGLNLKEEIGKNWVPTPMVHLGIGLPKSTDLKIRFMPEVDLGDDGSANMFGIGVMHDLKQWLPGFKVIPFDLSAFVGYTHLKLQYAYVPDDIQTENAAAEMVMNATTIQGVISKKFSVITLYGGLGYNIVKSNIGVKGKWDLNDNGTYETNFREINPVNIDFKTSGPRATAGFRLKLAVITLHADYTLQKYNALTVGFGINVR